MLIEFDPAKNAKNLRERGIGLERFADMDLEAAISVEDRRRNYGERCLRVLGYIDGLLHAGVITPRGEKIRVISFAASEQARGTSVCERTPVVPTLRIPSGPQRKFARPGR